MRATRFLISIALVMAAASFAHAQFSIGGPSLKMTVAMYPEVQKELKLTGDQKNQMQEAMKSMSQSTDMSSMSTDLDAKALANFTPDQMSRLTELWIQYNGAKALQATEVADKLKLTSEQTSKVSEIWDGYQQAYFDAMKNMRSASGMNSVKKKRKECEEASLAVLTADQAKAFADMQGKQFKFRQKSDL